MSKETPPSICRIAVLDYERYATTFLPNIEKAYAAPNKSAEAVENIKVLIANVKDRTLREDAMTQFERLHGAIQNNRWQYAAAGLMLEHACTEDAKIVDDLIPSLPLWIEILYADWVEGHAEAVQRFFSFLPDHTLHWASTPDAWRTAIGPQELDSVATAMGALTPRQFAKHLSSAENGDIFDNEEADTIAAWWNELRSVIRASRRQEAGLLITISNKR